MANTRITDSAGTEHADVTAAAVALRADPTLRFVRTTEKFSGPIKEPLDDAVRQRLGQLDGTVA